MPGQTVSPFFRLYKEFSILSTTFKTIRRNFRLRKLEEEAYLLKDFIKPGDVCFDIGGAYARYAYVLSGIVGPKGHVHSFEPGDYSHRVFSRIKSFHSLKNVSLFKMALSDAKGEMKLASPMKNKVGMGASLAYLSRDNQNGCFMETVRVSTVDDVAADLKIAKMDFLKCDVEGAELSVFRGGLRSITRFRPIVLSEVDRAHLRRSDLMPRQIFDFWADLKYVPLHLVKGVFTKVGAFEEDGNYLFVPQEKLNLFRI